MIVQYGDILNLDFAKTNILVLPVSGTISTDGMFAGAFGIAKHIAENHPEIVKSAGNTIKEKYKQTANGSYDFTLHFVKHQELDEFAFCFMRVAESFRDTQMKWDIVMQGLSSLADMASKRPELRFDMPYPVPSYKQQQEIEKTLQDCLPHNFHLWIHSTHQTEDAWNGYAYEEVYLHNEWQRLGKIDVEDMVRYMYPIHPDVIYAGWKATHKPKTIGSADHYYPGMTLDIKQ